MIQLPDAPWIQQAERTGYPDRERVGRRFRDESPEERIGALLSEMLLICGCRNPDASSVCLRQTASGQGEAFIPDAGGDAMNCDAGGEPG